MQFVLERCRAWSSLSWAGLSHAELTAMASVQRLRWALQTKKGLAIHSSEVSTIPLLYLLTAFNLAPFSLPASLCLTGGGSAICLSPQGLR